MLGYIQKDAGMGTYRLVTHNVSETELTTVSTHAKLVHAMYGKHADCDEQA